MKSPHLKPKPNPNPNPSSESDDFTDDQGITSHDDGSDSDDYDGINTIALPDYMVGNV